MLFMNFVIFKLMNVLSNLLQMMRILKSHIYSDDVHTVLIRSAIQSMNVALSNLNITGRVKTFLD